jgi:phytoene dehydrogenase-like protein
LDSGEELTARNVLSSAGWVETMKMCDDKPAITAHEAGQMSFIESVSILDRKPQTLGHPETIVFFNDSETFHWQRPDALCDLRTGVVCSPNNYLYDNDDVDKVLPDGVLRITSIANYDKWHSLEDEAYQRAKLEWYDRSAAKAVQFVPDFRSHVIDTDFFTPNTIRRFTWHDNGAVYGAPKKRFDGTTHVDNLFICGTDQGFVGIVGAIVSGISMANQHLLRPHDDP